MTNETNGKKWTDPREAFEEHMTWGLPPDDQSIALEKCIDQIKSQIERLEPSKLQAVALIFVDEEGTVGCTAAGNSAFTGAGAISLLQVSRNTELLNAKECERLLNIVRGMSKEFSGDKPWKAN